MNRRNFVKTSALAGGALVASRCLPFGPTAQAAPSTSRSQVALTGGTDHVDNIFSGLQTFKKQIATAIGNRTVLIKPNCVIGTGSTSHGDLLLSDTPVESLEGILEFLKSIGKTDVIIAEACATDPTMQAFANLNYFSLCTKYPVRFKDLSEEGYAWKTVWNTRSAVQSIRLSKVLLNSNYFVISAAVPKTHDLGIATLSLKCVVMGSPVVDPNLYLKTGGFHNDKGTMHSGTGSAEAQNLNDNLYRLAPLLAPDLSVIDGYYGMQGNGPNHGYAANQQAAVVSLDWLAADRVAVELMNLNAGIIANWGSSSNNSGFNWPMYPAALNYCAQRGDGQYDLSLIDVLGETIAALQMTYALPNASGNINNEYPMSSTPPPSTPAP